MTFPNGKDPEPTGTVARAGEFEQILWKDWLNGYWIETISMHEPIIFIRVDEPTSEKRKIPKGEQILRTRYVQGEDGFTYIKTLPKLGAKEVLIPIYTMKKRF